MKAIHNILSEVPLFKHCTPSEIDELLKESRLMSIKRGQLFDMKKITFFAIVINGIFEIEALGETDIVFLAPGSFFGTVPFTVNKHRGSIKALMDSSLLLFESEMIYKFFFFSFKSLRGYLKTTEAMGFEINEVGKGYTNNNTKIISVSGFDSQSGKSLYASLLGVALSKKDSAIILELSYDGVPIFDYFDIRITTPVSQKQLDGPSFEEMLQERIITIDENLSLLNCAFGSKVKFNIEILSPILFLLSKQFKYIIFDVSNTDNELQSKAFVMSDYVLLLHKSEKRVHDRVSQITETCKEGQRVYNIYNEYFTGELSEIAGGYSFQKIDLGTINSFNKLEAIIKDNVMEELVELLTKRKNALVLESTSLEAIYYSGLFMSLNEANIYFDLIYSSHFGFIIAALYTLLSDDEFEKMILKFFNEDRFSKFLDITFPEDYVFRNRAIHKFSQEVAGTKTIEMFNPLLITKLCQKNKQTRLFSSGNIASLMAASFLISPLFEPITINGNSYTSGFPEQYIKVEDLLRSDVDQITYVSLKETAKLQFKTDKIISFYKNFIEKSQLSYTSKDTFLADSNIHLELNYNEVDPTTLLNESKKYSDKIINLFENN